MTKKEMVYEILSNTNLSGINERELNKNILKIKKSTIEDIYELFKQNPDKANFYFIYLFYI